MNKRVLLIRNAYQQDTGGAEQYAFNLAKALKYAGHTPFVVTKHKAIHEKCAAEGIRSIEGIWHESQEWGKHYYLRYLLMPIWYAWLILLHRINVVHPQSRDDFIFATNAGWLLRKPVVWTDHADLKYIMDRKNHPHPRMQSWILNALKHVHKVLCVSHSEQDSIVSVAPEFKQKLAVVHNGVFVPDGLRPVPKDGDFVIGTNARLVEAKGISELMEAFATVSSDRNDLCLWLLGGFSSNKTLFEKKARQLGIHGKVKFLGYVSNPNDYVASMDIFVHASYHEAFSLAIIEACMLGRPIIATAVGGTPEIINESTGILIPAKDAPALATAINNLVSEPGFARRLGKAAQQVAVEEFDFQKIVETKIVPIYKGGEE